MAIHVNTWSDELVNDDDVQAFNVATHKYNRNLECDAAIIRALREYDHASRKLRARDYALSTYKGQRWPRDS